MSMITELIERLRESADDTELDMECSLALDGECNKLLREAADVIEELSTKLQAANMERSSQYYNGGWIPCSERLPEVNQRVLVTSYGRVCYAMMTSADGNSGHPVFRLQNSLNERVVCETTVHSEFTTSRIIAWMPLPEPYKAESKVIERNLCDSCTNKGCIFQYGIVRSHCDFYKAESEDKE